MERAARIFVLWVVSLTILYGCVGVPGQYRAVNVESVRQGIALATAELRAANFLLQDLIVKKNISKDDAQKALNYLLISKQSLSSANAAIAIGDPGVPDSQAQLARAIEFLDLVLAIMAPHVEQVEPPASTVYIEPFNYRRAA